MVHLKAPDRVSYIASAGCKVGYEHGSHSGTNGSQMGDVAGKIITGNQPPLSGGSYNLASCGVCLPMSHSLTSGAP